jgi:hypothetical protein
VVLTPHYDSLSLADLPYSAFSALVSVDSEGKPLRYLAAPDWNWERFYTAIVKSYLNGGLGALLNTDREESPITSFWWGLGGGVVDVRLGAWSSGTPNNLLRYLRGSIARNLYQPVPRPGGRQRGRAPYTRAQRPAACRDHQDALSRRGVSRVSSNGGFSGLPKP